MQPLHQYTNGNTLVTLFDDGTKVRECSSAPIAEFPESADVKITNWCDAGCAHCHENSTVRGLHGNLQPIVDLFKQLPAGVEIAIGGGHPMAHPDFDNFVKELSTHGIICNVTINEKHFAKELPRIERLVADKCIYGVGYSYSSIPCEWHYENLVSHVIIGTSNYNELQDIVKVNPKVLLLGYKKYTGRGTIFYQKNATEVDRNIASWYAGLFYAARKAHLSFDNRAIEQLNPRRLFKTNEAYEQMFMGEDGEHTMYIDAVKQEFATSSTSEHRFPLSSDIRQMFMLV